MSTRALVLLSLCTVISACSSSSRTSSSDATMSTADAENSVVADTDNAEIDATETSDDDVTPDTPPAATVAATILVADPGAGGGSAGVTVTSNGTDAITDETGRATVDVKAAAAYEVVLTKGDTRIHRVFGIAGEEPFEQITYMSSEMITSFVFNSLGLTDDTERGILVVGLDLPSLAPAVGASAAIDLQSSEPFVFAGIQPTFSDTIPETGQGFITFPNVEPGVVTITVSYPEGSCRVFPAETEDLQVPVTAGEVSIIAYTCRAE